VARLFFAVCSPPEVAAEVHRVQERLRRALPGTKLSWPAHEQAHCTIKFLGEVGEERRDSVLRAGRALARIGRPFELALARIGAFPDRRGPQVIWLGVSDGAAEITKLAAGLDRLLVTEGFEAEGRLFVPHLTLARIKSRAAAAAAARTIDPMPDVGPVGRWEVRSFALMESVTTPAGVRYTAVETFLMEPEPR
jgi:2'-5' RNA ligase